MPFIVAGAFRVRIRVEVYWPSLGCFVIRRELFECDGFLQVPIGRAVGWWRWRFVGHDRGREAAERLRQVKPQSLPPAQLGARNDTGARAFRALCGRARLDATNVGVSTLTTALAAFHMARAASANVAGSDSWRLVCDNPSFSLEIPLWGRELGRPDFGADYPFISRIQCRFERVDGECEIESTGSNPTQLRRDGVVKSLSKGTKMALLANDEILLDHKMKDRSVVVRLVVPPPPPPPAARSLPNCPRRRLTMSHRYLQRAPTGSPASPASGAFRLRSTTARSIFPKSFPTMRSRARPRSNCMRTYSISIS